MSGETPRWVRRVALVAATTFSIVCAGVGLMILIMGVALLFDGYRFAGVLVFLSGVYMLVIVWDWCSDLIRIWLKR